MLKEVGRAALLGLLSLLPAAAVPVAAVPVAAVPEAAIRATYLCQGRFDAVRLTALFFNGEPREVVLLQGEQAVRLPQQPSCWPSSPHTHPPLPQVRVRFVGGREGK